MFGNGVQGVPGHLGGPGKLHNSGAAIKVHGSLVFLSPQEFDKLIHRTDELVIVISTAGLISKKTQYLTSYKGLVMFTESKQQLNVPATHEIIHADHIILP